jgi:hypothetical protein
LIDSRLIETIKTDLCMFRKIYFPIELYSKIEINTINNIY